MTGIWVINFILGMYLMLDYGWFFLKWNIWNNSFSYPYDNEHQLWVPFLKDVSYEWLINTWVEVGGISVFSEINEEWKIQEFIWLKSFFCFEINWTTVYIFDNHNHAYAFWRREVLKWVIKKGTYLLHIDQHSDMNENKFQLEDETWEDIVHFANNCCNVWNFILPALDCWLISDAKQLRTEQWLLCFNKPHTDYILDIDLDYWDERMWISDFDWTIKKTKNLIQSAKLVTIATSPYFLNQWKAIELINLLLFNP